MKQFTLLVPMALLFAAPVLATQSKEIDPADVTNVYTQGAIMLNGSSDTQLQGQFSGSLEDGRQFALLGELTLTDEQNVAQRDDNEFGTRFSAGRLQYFHVFDANSEDIPKVGISVDYIKTNSEIKTDLLSIGGVFAINPEHTSGLLLYPRFGLTTGTMKVNGVSDGYDDVMGYSLSVISAKYLGTNGAYVTVVPEWQDLTGDDIDMHSLSVKTSLNVPLNKGRSWWLNTRYDVSKTEVDVFNRSVPSEWQTQAWIGVRHYF
ncbi:hypothetical protein E2K93_12970 [Thalassotalea sp. HSM 43]|uniref:hypothetical protein n=1 Tax=Thalassotalea sp. HSM 43 TaxID=2552945 RepID=UPI0010809E32|nr:hypothetical protein [Thalassotalea sp. HSM 43]QBY05236.1 hypothetical protein E2K93_12970 [Thalassotalea sp. HSM 43]